MKNLYIYRNLQELNIFNNVFNDNEEGLIDLIKFGYEHGFSGNLWTLYLTYELAYNENPFSLSCENNGNISGSNDLILHDLRIFYEMFHKDLKVINEKLASDIENYTFTRKNYEHYDHEIIDLLTILHNEILLCTNERELFDTMSLFYQKNGVGDLGFHKAFRIGSNGKLIPIKDVSKVSFDDLVGYAWQKERIIQNTKSFVEGKYANNALLYGDSGTGKSTSIKAVLNQFYPKGLRMIEVYKHQMTDVVNLMAEFKKRHYAFIIYMDDLSFEEHEIEYKHLKSIIEGGLENKPNNVLVYATSNRRHLIKETMADNGTINDDLHRNETKAEKLSLAARFGLQILFLSLDNQEFKKMVSVLAKRYNIVMDESELLYKANQWEIKYGNLSGRTAEQFVKFIAGGGKDI